MESGRTVGTVVLNLMDGREKFFALPPEKAVIAAFGEFDLGGYISDGFLNSQTHLLKEYRLGYSCGDWIAYKDRRILQ